MTVTSTAAAFDERAHPRAKRGQSDGGQFVGKQRAQPAPVADKSPGSVRSRQDGRPYRFTVTVGWGSDPTDKDGSSRPARLWRWRLHDAVHTVTVSDMRVDRRIQALRRAVRNNILDHIKPQVVSRHLEFVDNYAKGKISENDVLYHGPELQYPLCLIHASDTELIPGVLVTAEKPNADLRRYQTTTAGLKAQFTSVDGVWQHNNPWRDIIRLRAQGGRAGEESKRLSRLEAAADVCSDMLNDGSLQRHDLPRLFQTLRTVAVKPLRAAPPDPQPGVVLEALCRLGWANEIIALTPHPYVRKRILADVSKDPHHSLLDIHYNNVNHNASLNVRWARYKPTHEQVVDLVTLMPAKPKSAGPVSLDMTHRWMTNPLDSEVPRFIQKANKLRDRHGCPYKGLYTYKAPYSDPAIALMRFLDKGVHRINEYRSLSNWVDIDQVRLNQALCFQIPWLNDRASMAFIRYSHQAAKRVFFLRIRDSRRSGVTSITIIDLLKDGPYGVTAHLCEGLISAVKDSSWNRWGVSSTHFRQQIMAWTAAACINTTIPWDALDEQPRTQQRMVELKRKRRAVHDQAILVGFDSDPTIPANDRERDFLTYLLENRRRSIRLSDCLDEQISLVGAASSPNERLSNHRNNAAATAKGWGKAARQRVRARMPKLLEHSRDQLRDKPPLSKEGLIGLLRFLSNADSLPGLTPTMKGQIAMLKAVGMDRLHKYQ